jgi:phosphoglycerate-specific signal transduction histidine kinase
MAQNGVIERKNEILKRKIESLILRQNKNGLNQQDNQLMQRFIKEMHHNNYSLR